MNIRSPNAKGNNAVGSFIDKIQSPNASLDIDEGEVIRVKLLEYLGGGKMVIDLKGQRVVANSNLMLEKGQEINVLIKNITDGKIILQILTDALPERQCNQSSFPICDLIVQLKHNIGNMDSQTASLFGDKLKKISDLLDSVFIHVTDNKEGLSEDIRNSLSLIGYDHEGKIASFIKNDGISKLDFEDQIKSELLQFRDRLIEIIDSIETKRGTLALEKLVSSANGLLEQIESYQVKSIIQTDDIMHLLFALPVILDDQETTVEFDYSRQQNRSSEDKAFAINIRFDLDELGKIEFVVNLVDKNLNCLIRIENHQTYNLMKHHYSELGDSLDALGYEVDSLHCVIQNPKHLLSQNNVNLIDTNA